MPWLSFWCLGAFLMWCPLTILSLNSGENCDRDLENIGVCSSINSCPSAITEMKKGLSPRLCNVENNELVICCQSSRNGMAAKCPQLPQEVTTAKKTGNKSWDKCIDWVEHVFPCEEARSGLPLKYRRNVCGQNRMPMGPNGSAKQDEFPHMALLEYSKTKPVAWDCAGILISDRWVMTTAHCASEKLTGPLHFIRLGSPNIDDPKDPDYTYTVTEIVIHPEFTPGSIYNDIALVKLFKTVVFTERVRPACLHIGSSISTDYLVAGWGRNFIKGFVKDHLKKMDVVEVSHAECSRKNPSNRLFSDSVRNSSQLCARPGTGDEEVLCEERGSALQVYSDEVFCSYSIVGFTSHGRKCSTQGDPSVYTRVSAFIPWIESIVWPDDANESL